MKPGYRIAATGFHGIERNQKPVLILRDDLSSFADKSTYRAL
jgi:hypothetical protein